MRYEIVQCVFAVQVRWNVHTVVFMFRMCVVAYMVQNICWVKVLQSFVSFLYEIVQCVFAVQVRWNVHTVVFMFRMCVVAYMVQNICWVKVLQSFVFFLFFFFLNNVNCFECLNWHEFRMLAWV